MDELQATTIPWDELIAIARQTCSRAYAPYSRFAVGAAILSTSGRIFSGCNVENASYGLSICAERNALFQMVSHGDREIVAIMIYTPTTMPTAPCGACRQVLFEFGPRALIRSCCDGDTILETTVAELLPRAFGPNSLTE